jgi:hypothetical protein
MKEWLHHPAYSQQWWVEAVLELSDASTSTNSCTLVISNGRRIYGISSESSIIEPFADRALSLGKIANVIRFRVRITPRTGLECTG